MATSICFEALKGGLGKSTVTAIFCKWLQNHKQRVLAVDLDGQGDLTNWVKHTENKEIKPRLSFIDGVKNLNLSKSVVHFNNYLDVIPASMSTFGFPLVLEKYGRQDRHFILGELIKKLNSSYHWDWIVFDIPPSVSELLVNVDVFVSNVVLLMQSQFSSYSGIVDSARYLQSLIGAYRNLSKKRFGISTKLTGILPSIVDSSGRVDNFIMKQAHKKFGQALLPIVKQRQRVKRWDLTGIPDVDNGDYWDMRTWKMYDHVFSEIVRRIA